MHAILLAALLAWAPAHAAPAASTSAAAVATASVHTGGQPDQAELAAHAAAGVRRVIDLRGPDEPRGMDEAAVVAGLGMEYVALPVSGPQDLTVARAQELSRLVDEAGGPVLVHCASGNRVGALLALEAFHVDGLDAEQALQVGLQGGLRSLEPTVRSLLVR